MADDLDLDAMLDSALDEEFAAPNVTAKTDGGDDGELDLDAMLDEAIETSLETTGEVQPQQGAVCSAADKPSSMSKGRASSDFGPSQDWLQRKQGRGNGAGSLGGKGPQGPFSFLRPERREAWKVAFAEDAQRQADMDKQRPLSRAYRSFYSTGKGEGDIVVHLGSAASAKGKAGVVKGDESRGADGDEASGTMGEIFDDVLGKGVANSGVNQPPESVEEDCEILERLKVSYLALVAKDVRARLSKDPDVSAERFPGIVSKILA